MESGVGASLREARKRRDLDLTEVEAAIKIRVRYLQAIEDEDWDVLPGDVYARGFIRTYAAHLGLDGERLAAEHRREAGGEREEPGLRRVEPVGSVVPPNDRRRFRGRALTLVVVLAVAALLVAVGLAGQNGDEAPAPQGTVRQDRAESQTGAGAVATRPGVALELTAREEVWVCLLATDEQPLLDGEILQPGEAAGPFRSRGFSVAFGNGGVELEVDERPVPTAESSGPIGYEIDATGELAPLAEGERPDCA